MNPALDRQENMAFRYVKYCALILDVRLHPVRRLKASSPLLWGRALHLHRPAGRALSI